MVSLALAVMLAMQPAVDGPARLGDIRMQLVYTESGRLSRDISPPNAFTGWNTVIGEGDAGQPANDMEVSVELRTNGRQNVRTPVTLTARRASGRTIATRTFNNTLTSADGRAVLSLRLADIGCAGRIRVTATLGRQSRSEEIVLDCGE